MGVDARRGWWSWANVSEETEKEEQELRMRHKKRKGAGEKDSYIQSDKKIVTWQCFGAVTSRATIFALVKDLNSQRTLGP